MAKDIVAGIDARSAEESFLQRDKFVVGQNEIVENQPAVEGRQQRIEYAVLVLAVIFQGAPEIEEAGRILIVLRLDRGRVNVVQRGVERGLVGESARSEKRRENQDTQQATQQRRASIRRIS